jgi:Na+/proline symporter
LGLYSMAAAGILVLHLLFILWVAFGALFTRRRPLLRWSHIASLIYGILLEILNWPCPLTPMENWFRGRAGIPTYGGGFLLHYLDALVYPDVPPSLLVLCASAVCLFNLGIYAVRFRRRRAAVW